MLVPYFAAAATRAATRDDASIPRRSHPETRGMSAWTVTVQASAFLAVAVLPVLLIRDQWTGPATTAVVAGLSVMLRQSQLRYQRIRLI